MKPERHPKKKPNPPPPPSPVSDPPTIPLPAQESRNPPRRSPQRILFWLLMALLCGIVAWKMVSAHPREPIDNQGVPIAASIGGDIEYPKEAASLLRTPPVFIYSFDGIGNPEVLANMETLDTSGSVGIALTDLADDGLCTLTTAPVHETKSGASVNYDSDVSREKDSRIRFTRLGAENRLDETAWMSIHRTWWRAQLALSAPRMRYVVDCPVTIRPSLKAFAEREISFLLPRGIHFAPVFPDGEMQPKADDTIGMVMFRLDGADNLHYEGRVADTPNSVAAHRFKVTFIDGKVTAQWTDARAARQRDLWQFMAGALAAFAATILFELLKLWLPLER